MKILYLSSEVAPFSKTGGLGDVAGSLPVALGALGHELCVVSPLYSSVDATSAVPDSDPLTLNFPFGEVEVRFHRCSMGPGVEHVFVEQADFFARGSFYGYPDDARRFAAFTMAALAYAQRSRFAADVVHSNDWQTGLSPLILKLSQAQAPLGRALTVHTIHNLSYQGNFHWSDVSALGVPASAFTLDGAEFYGQFSFMKAGLVFSDVVSTVSPSYAAEIQTPLGGHGFHGVLRARRRQLHGILNGVDTSEWNPATDVLLPARYSANDVSGKAVCRRALLKAFDLEVPRPGWPLLGVVGRMVEQKGADFMQGAVPQLLEHGAGVVVLGAGDAELEAGWRRLQARFPRRLGVRVGFDNSLAHLIEAGSDFFLMPSRFEPCGLNQMYSLLYGAVPVVREVGGLKDTVVDVRLGQGTGVVFSEPSTEALFRALLRAVELFRRPAEYERVQRRGMSQDFSWERAARAYTALYGHARSIESENTCRETRRQWL